MSAKVIDAAAGGKIVTAGRRPKSGVPSLRAISEELAARGHLSATGKSFSAKSIASMLER
jgi:hypothetical protein